MWWCMIQCLVKRNVPERYSGLITCQHELIIDLSTYLKGRSPQFTSEDLAVAEEKIGDGRRNSYNDQGEAGPAPKLREFRQNLPRKFRRRIDLRIVAYTLVS